MTIESTVHIWREGNQFVAHAMPIDVISSGPTAEAARKAVDDAIRLFLTVTEEAGTRDDVLRECGYERHGDAWVSPEFVAVERLALAV